MLQNICSKNHYEYRCESNDGEVPFDNYVKIDNSKLAADVVARMIKEKFAL
jgi:hypothetical protein